MDETKQKVCRIIGVALAALPLAACLAVLFAPRPALANVSRPLTTGTVDEHLGLVVPAASCNGTADDGPALAAAQTAAGATKAIRITCKLRIASAVGSITAPIIFEGSGQIHAVTGGSVTIAGPFQADLRQVFYVQGGTITVAAPMDPARPRWWGASGSSTSTTGSITSGTATLTVASATSFVVGQGISVAAAGAAGARLVTSIVAISGTTFTLATNASTTVSGQAVHHDDTAALLAAITGGLHVRMADSDYHRITSTLNLRSGSRFIGAGVNSTTIDAAFITDATAILGPANSHGVEIRGFVLLGPNTNGTRNSVGIDPGNQALQPVVTDVLVKQFYRNLRAQFNHKAVWGPNVVSDIPRNAAMEIEGGDEIYLIGVHLANVAGYYTGDPSNHWPSNLRIFGAPRDVVIHDAVIDEGFTSTGASNSTMIYSGDRISISNSRIYYTHGGGGLVLDAPTNCTIHNVRVERFSAGAAPSSRVYVRGSGHVLINVSTDSADGGTRVDDASTDPTWVNVDGAWRQPTTDSSGTPGNATINKASGKVALAGAAASVVVTNSLVTAASIVTATMQATDATCTSIKSVVPAAGSFTITANAACTAATKIAFTVMN